MSNKRALAPKELVQPTDILNQLQSGQLLRVKAARGNAIIICHRHYAELAGPGAAVGSVFDLDCVRVVPVGKISLIYPESGAERKKAYMMRQRWILFTQKAMVSYVPLQRSKNLLILMHKYFKPQLIEELPDEVLANLIGVLPTTMAMARKPLQLRQKSELTG